MKNQRKIGTLLSYLLMGVNILTSLIYTPVMLRILGQNEYGLYQLSYSIVSYLSILNLGFTSSYMRFYSRLKVKDDIEEIAKLNGMYMSIFLIISAICVVAGAAMICNIEKFFSTGLTVAETEKSKVLLAFMVFNMALSFPLGGFSSILNAHEEFFVQRGISVIVKLLNPFLTLPLLLLGYGSVGMVFITTVLTVGDFIAESLFCIKKLNVKFIFWSFDFKKFSNLGKFTFWIFLMNIAGQINMNLDKYLLGRMLGTAAVAVYSVGSTMYSMYQYPASILAGIFSPLINMLVAENRDKEVSDLFVRVGRIQYFTLMLVLTGFTIFGQEFIYLWSGSDYNESYWIALLLMYSATIPFTQNLGVEIQTAKNMHQMRSVVYFIIAILNVCISIPLISHIGATGAALGTAVSLILGNTIFMNIYYHIRIKIDIIDYWKNIGRITLPMILPFGLGLIYTRFFSITFSWPHLAICIVVYSAVYSLAVWLLALNPYEKNLVINIMEKIAKRI